MQESEIELKFLRIVFLEMENFYIIEVERPWVFFDLEVSGEVEIPLPYAEEYISKMIGELESLLEFPITNGNGYFWIKYSKLHRKIPIHSLDTEKALEDLKAFLAFIKERKEG